MGPAKPAAIAFALAALALTPASSAAHRYADPVGDYSPPRYIRHPDIISLSVSNTALAVRFDINFARAPLELDSVDVLLDLDSHGATRTGSGRFRQAEVTLSDRVWEAYRAGTRERAWVFFAPVIDPAPVAWIRASGKAVHLTMPIRFVMTDSAGHKHKVVIPRHFRFFVWAWANDNVDHYLPDEDLAPNSRWFTYRATRS